MTRQILAHVLNNNRSLKLDEKGNPIPKIFDEHHWKQVEKFTDPPFKFIKYLDEAPKAKAVNVNAKVVTPNPTGGSRGSIEKNPNLPEAKMTKSLEGKGKSVKIFIKNIENFTIPELKLFLNDERKTIVKLAKEQIEKLK